MTFLPKKGYSGKILKLSLPIIAGLSTQMILSIVDTAMVGRLENAKFALAAMGLGLLATWAIVALSSSYGTGTHVLVARRFGEENFEACKDVLMNSLMIGFLLGIVVGAGGMLSSYPVAHLFTPDETVGDLAADYMFYRFVGLPFFLITIAYRGFFFGIGKPQVFMVSAVGINLLNILFNYMFIYGAFGAPRMGLAGASIGSSLATVVDALFYTTMALGFKQFRVKFSLFRHIKIMWEIWGAIFRISLPISFQNVFTLLGFLSFVAITGLIGTMEQAATQTIISSLFISFMPCNGFGIAVQTLIGNQLGRGGKEEAKRYGYETVKIGTIFTLIVAVLFFAIPQYILNITTNEWDIINTAVPAMRIAGFAQIFFAAGLIFAFGLQAVGKTFFVMMTEMIVNLFFFVPLAYLFGVVFEWGLEGAWAALPAYTITYALIMGIKFRYGSWKNKISI